MKPTNMDREIIAMKETLFQRLAPNLIAMRTIKNANCINWVLLIFLLGGCATVGGYQQDCEDAHSNFSDQITCLKEAVKGDSRMKGDGRVRLYLAKADQLVSKVASGEIDELDARVELQEYYLALRNDETAERQRNAEIEASKKPVNTDTRCTVYGNTANCKSKQY